jgi:hypothetical protein
MYQLSPLAMLHGQTIDASMIQELQHPTRGARKVVTEKADMRRMLTQALQSSGMFADEAGAMIDTWENGYLRVPGLRVLYVLPRQEVDQILPVTLTPAADQFNRAFIARVEILTDLEEARIIEDIFGMANPKMYPYYGLGRFAEAKLRRVREVLADHTDVLNGYSVEGAAAVLDALVDNAAFGLSHGSTTL